MEPVFVLDVAFMEFVITLLWGAVCQKEKKEHLEAWRHQTPDLYICYTNKRSNDYRPRDGPKEVLFFSFFFFCFLNYHCCYANCVKLLQTPCFQKICHEEAKEALFHCKCQWIIPRWLIYPPNHTRWRSRRRISSKHHYTVLQCARMKSNESKWYPNAFLIGDILHSCIPFESRAFSYLPFHFDKPFFVSCTCLHCISHCPKEKQY